MVLRAQPGAQPLLSTAHSLAPATEDQERCPPELASLINDCWHADPRARPGIGDALKVITLIMKVGTWRGSVCILWPAQGITAVQHNRGVAG